MRVKGNLSYEKDYRMKTLNLAILFLCIVTSAMLATTASAQTAEELKQNCFRSANGADYQEGIRTCTLALERTPNDVSLRHARGFAFFNGKMFVDAMDDFEEALKIVPNDPRALAYRGMIYTAQAKFAAALRDLNKAISLAPKDTYPLFKRAELYHNTNRNALAIADLKTILTIKPEDQNAKGGIELMESATKPFVYKGKTLTAPAMYWQSAAALEKSNATFEAVDLLTECARRFPDDYDCSKRLLAAYERLPDNAFNFGDKQRNDWAKSNYIAIYSAILKKEPNDIELLKDRAFTYTEEQENYAAALADTSNVIALKSKKSPPAADIDEDYLMRCDLNIRLENYAAALADINNAIALKSKQSPSAAEINKYFQIRAGINTKLKSYAAALADLNILIAAEPKNGKFYHQRADIQFSLKNLGAALADIHKAVQFAANPQSKSLALAYRATVHMVLKMYDLAITDYTNSLSINPDPEIYLSRSVVYRLHGKIDLAEADAKRAAELRGKR